MFSTANELTAILPEVIEMITRAGNLRDLSGTQDFYDAGVTSIMALPILLDIEDRYGICIPDSTFVSARTALAVAQIVEALRKE
jgi:acyl carrier protein